MIRKLIIAAALAFGLALPPSGPAAATILFAGGEDIDFTLVGSASIDTSAGDFRSGYARLALSTTAATGDPPANRITSPTFSATTVIWLHAETSTNTAATTSNNQSIRIYGSDGVARIIVRGTGTSGQTKISTRNTAGTITDLVTCTSGTWPVSSALSKLDVFLNYAVAGQVTFYVNNVQVCDFSGDVTTNSVTAVNQVEFSGGTSTGNFTRWSEVIVATTDTRVMGLVTLAPAANGNTMAWTGAVTDVNETTLSDTTFISSGSADQLAQFTVGSLPAGTWSVPAVIQSARLLVGATGPQNFRWSLRVGGADFDNGSDLPGTTSFANYRKIWETSPATSTDWASSELGAGFNAGLKSRN